LHALQAHPSVSLYNPIRRTFPPTRHSVFEALAGRDEPARRAAADVFVRAYWGPVAALLELRWNLERADAEDLTQEFFAEAIEKEWFTRYDGARGRFRTFLRTCVDCFAANDAKARRRLKRGGGIPDAPLDSPDAAGLHAPDESDARIHDEWVRSILSIALDEMRDACAAEGKHVQMGIFEAYDVADPPDETRPTYRSLAIQFDIPETQVTNFLARARRDFRRHVLAALRSLAATDDEFREDARDLLGARPS
jgi:DNA-directed RNA polymerase specialized sigma24 family protein